MDHLPSYKRLDLHHKTMQSPMSLYFPAIRHIIKYLTVVCVLLTQVNAEDSPAPHVLAYSAGRGGYFEVAVPVDLAPFTIHAIPEDFEFDATMCYTSDESSSITDGTLGFASSRAAYVYTDDGSSKHDTIRVGFALNVPEEITEDIIAEFTIQPEDFGTAYFTVDATLNTEMLSYDDNLVRCLQWTLLLHLNMDHILSLHRQPILT
ncbi:unnamed protein product [Ambrosiozyma monospora]|uniref:Unnamed protein product n=1 Tax=Ambrosiozyma monospora TaxID=43982 RepID=A0ACB5T6L8_AMBMO|nr:unnamed protein product [Ambrosiozyma monospora]